MTLTPIERRAASNPAMIGVLAGIVSPLSSIIWGIRQRSWSLSLVPFSLALIGSFLASIDTKGEKLPAGIKYSYQMVYIQIFLCPIKLDINS